MITAETLSTKHLAQSINAAEIQESAHASMATPDVVRETSFNFWNFSKPEDPKRNKIIRTTDQKCSATSYHHRPNLSLFAPAALVCVASSRERIEDTALECFESVVIAVVVALSPSRPEVNQFKAALARSVIVVVVVEVVVVRCGLAQLAPDFDVVDGLLPPEFVELVVEVSQSRAAWIGLAAPVDGLTLEAVDDDKVADAVLLFDGSEVARIRNENSDMNSSSASSPEPWKGSQVTGVRSLGVPSSSPVHDFVVVKEVELKSGIRGGS